jgi:hypothetical protein
MHRRARGIVPGICPDEGPVVVLVDWTDLYPHTPLVFALPRDGRALPFLSKTVHRGEGEGSRIAAETCALDAFAALCPADRPIISVADLSISYPNAVMLAKGGSSKRHKHKTSANGLRVGGRRTPSRFVSICCPKGYVVGAAGFEPATT